MANVNVAGDGAILKYKDACGSVEQGLKEMLERIYGHLDKLYDEMMARSLKRRAVFLSECIQAEIVRQADLMLQLSRLDEVLERKLSRMRAECIDGSPRSGQKVVDQDGDAGYQDEQIEDCDEALEQQRITTEDAERSAKTTKEAQTLNDRTSGQAEPSSERKPSQATSRKPEAESSSRATTSESVPNRAEFKLGEKQHNDRQLSESQPHRGEPRQSRVVKPEHVKAASTTSAIGNDKGFLGHTQHSSQAQSHIGGVQGQQATYTPVYLNPSCLTYAYANPTNFMYLGNNGTTTVDAAQLAAALQNQIPLGTASTNNQTTAPYTLVPAVLGSSDPTNAYATLTTASGLSPYTQPSMASYPTLVGSGEQQYGDARTQTFNINGVPVNGLVFNLPEQATAPTMSHMGVLSGSGDSNHCVPLMNTAYLGQQQQHYQYNTQPIQVQQQPQQNYQPYQGYPMYGYYPGYY